MTLACTAKLFRLNSARTGCAPRQTRETGGPSNLPMRARHSGTSDQGAKRLPRIARGWRPSLGVITSKLNKEPRTRLQQETKEIAEKRRKNQKINKAPIDASVFLAALQRVPVIYALCIYGYVLTPEHAHVLVNEPQRVTLASGG